VNYKTIIKAISLIIILNFSLSSCEKKEKLSNEDKIKILAEVFSDKTNLTLFFKKCIFINIQITRPHSMFYNGIDYDSYNDYVSDVLKIEDANFVEQQINENRNLKINFLRNFDFKFQNLEEKKTNDNCYTMISKPLFNKSEDCFYIIIQENGSQNQYLFKKNSDKWVLEKKFGLAIE
jgi:hypothetical protein